MKYCWLFIKNHVTAKSKKYYEIYNLQMPKKSLSKNMEVSDRRKSYVVKDVIDYKI